MADLAGFKYVFNCAQCGAEFGAIRATKKYCSNKCKFREQNARVNASPSLKLKTYRAAFREKNKAAAKEMRASPENKAKNRINAQKSWNGLSDEERRRRSQVAYEKGRGRKINYQVSYEEKTR